jgi:hypothetical protein
MIFKGGIIVYAQGAQGARGSQRVPINTHLCELRDLCVILPHTTIVTGKIQTAHQCLLIKSACSFFY